MRRESRFNLVPYDQFIAYFIQTWTSIHEEDTVLLV